METSPEAKEFGQFVGKQLGTDKAHADYMAEFAAQCYDHYCNGRILILQPSRRHGKTAAREEAALIGKTAVRLLID